MKFKKEFLQNFEGKTISDEICDHSRWSLTYYRIFMHDGKYYGTSYSRGATEMQDERPYEYDDDEIELEELFPYQGICHSIFARQPNTRPGARKRQNEFNSRRA